MTVQELINELNKIEDKSKTVFACGRGTERLAVTAIEDDVEQFIDVLFEDGYEDSEDKIHLTGCIEDILDQAEQNDIELTKEEAREALRMVKDNHDCTYGVSWDTIK